MPGGALHRDTSLVNIDQAALEDFLRGPVMREVLIATGNEIRDRARRNAATIDDRLVDAISTGDPETDAEGVYIDVGYDKTKPGWVLWFHEVGTVDEPARPHLRPALTEG